MLRNRLVIIGLTLLLASCGDSKPTESTDAADIGVDTSGDADVDNDSILPAVEVVSVIPLDGAEDVSTLARVEIIFTVAMDPGEGVVSLAALDADDDRDVAVPSGTWANPRTWQWTFEAPLLSTTAYAVALRGFVGADGGELVPFGGSRFTTRDDLAPYVLSASPAEGATGVLRATNVRVEFNEPIGASAGLSLSGGNGAVDLVVVDGAVLTATLSGLEYDTAYQLRFVNVMDLAGNGMRDGPVLEDGVLDFTTTSDIDGPTVVSALPGEDGVDVNPDLLAQVVVDFDEAMDTSITTATLDNGNESFLLTGGSWSNADRTLSLPVSAEQLLYQGPHRVDLRGHQDVLGNTLQPGPYLADGWLDFTTGNDLALPFVLSAVPNEGGVLSDLDVATMDVRFSEAMDSAITAATLTTPSGDVSLALTWSVGDTIANIEVAGVLVAGSDYSLDLSVFRDVNGNPLVDPDPLLGDTRLDFTTRAGTGETCREALTINEAVGSAGGWTWALGPSAVAVADGAGEECDITGSGVDAFFVYEKTSDTLANGGAMLKIEAQTATRALNLVVYDGDCLAGVLHSCMGERSDITRYEDLPPGRYYIAVAVEDDTLSFPAVTLTVTEVTSAPEGENCSNPWTTQSSTVSFGHIWTIPVGSAVAADGLKVHGVDGPWCAANGTRERVIGADMVFEVPKTGSAAVLVEVTTDQPVVAWFTDSCSASSASLGCTRVDSTGELRADGPGPNLYLWIAPLDGTSNTPNVEVRFSAELAFCGAQQTLVTGSNDTRHWGTGSWFSCRGGATGARAWGTFTAQVDGVLRVGTDDSNPMAVRNMSTWDEEACVFDATIQDVAHFLRAGDEVCVGTVSFNTGGPRYWDVTFDPMPSPLDVGALAVTSGQAQGNVIPFADAGWLTAGGGVIHLGDANPGAVSTADGGQTAIVHTTANGSLFSQSGVDAVMGPSGQLYALNTSPTTTSPRIHQLWDGVNQPWTPVVWELAPRSYASSSKAIATDGSTLIFSSYERSGQPTEFYSVSAVVGGSPLVIGSNDQLQEVMALEVDASYLYALGRVGTDWSVYRIARADLSVSTTAPTRIALVFADPITEKGGLALSDTMPAILALRVPGRPGIEAIVSPETPRPAWAGQIATTGALAPPWDLAWDTAGQKFVAISADKDPLGQIVEID